MGLLSFHRPGPMWWVLDGVLKAGDIGSQIQVPEKEGNVSLLLAFACLLNPCFLPQDLLFLRTVGSRSTCFFFFFQEIP